MAPTSILMINQSNHQLILPPAIVACFSGMKFRENLWYKILCKDATFLNMSHQNGFILSLVPEQSTEPLHCTFYNCAFKHYTCLPFPSQTMMVSHHCNCGAQRTWKRNIKKKQRLRFKQAVKHFAREQLQSKSTRINQNNVLVACWTEWRRPKEAVWCLTL